MYVTRLVLKNLDNQSLIRSTKAKRGFAEFLDDEKFFWIRIVKKYIGKFEGVEESSKEVLYRTPANLMKRLALAVE